MSKTVSIHGVVPVIPTPFHPDESIDVDSLRNVVDWVAIAIFLTGFVKAAWEWVRCEAKRGINGLDRHRHWPAPGRAVLGGTHGCGHSRVTAR